ncbi:MAG: ribonuclease E/G, partial [Alphaproteobacteria bacterium]|nr:ribonuclease E/G [Alphaproteobacteria bacterium]
ATVTEVAIDDEATFRRAREYADREMPALGGRLRFHAGPGPVLARHDVLDEIALIEGPRVPLPSGGAITIEATRALTAIDVDSGRDTGGQDQESVALRTNLEAARELARQMRLRDIGGIIVVDFIELRNPASRERLMERLASEIRRDRAPVRLSGLSEFGLVEMTRRRASVALGTRHRENCATCGGSGRQPSVKAEMAAALRALLAEGAALPGRALSLHLPPRVADALLAHPALARARQRLGAGLEIVADESLAAGQHRIAPGRGAPA